MKLKPIIPVLTTFLIIFLSCHKEKGNESVIAFAKDAGKLEQFAAREIRKYIYLRTGELLKIEENNGDGKIIKIAPILRKWGVAMLKIRAKWVCE